MNQCKKKRSERAVVVTFVSLWGIVFRHYFYLIYHYLSQTTILILIQIPILNILLLSLFVKTD